MNHRFYRWVGFVMAMWVMAISGTNYTFSNYSGALKEALNINQVQLNYLSVAKDLGKALGIVAGVASDHIPAWCVLIIGSSIGFLGFGIQWLVVSGTVDPLPYWTMFIAAVLGGNSVAWFNTAILRVCIGNFARNRGPVVGLLKGYLGLSAAIFADFCDFLFAGTSANFLLMLTLAPSVVCSVAASFIRPVPPAGTDNEEKEDRQSMLWFNTIAAGLALYLIFIDIFIPEEAVAKKVFAAILFLLLIAPISVPSYLTIKRNCGVHVTKENVKEGVSRLASDAANERGTTVKADAGNGSPNFDNHSRSSLKEPLLRLQASEGTSDNCLEESEEVSFAPHEKCLKKYREGRGFCAPLSELGKDRSVSQILRSCDFWVYYVSCLCAGGAGMAFSNNLGQIGQAIGFQSVTIFTSLFSVGGFFGRILSGILSEHFLRTAGVPRSVWMAVAKLPMIGMFFWLAVGSKGSLYVGTPVMGLCYGFEMAIMIPMVSEFYGLKNFGKSYNVSMTVLLVGSFLFSGCLAGTLYDREAAKQQGKGGMSSVGSSSSSSSGGIRWLGTSDVTCYGPACYRLTFVILALFLIMGTGLDIVLAFMTRPLYRRLQSLNASMT